MMHDVRISADYSLDTELREMVNQMIISNKHARISNNIQILDRMLEHGAIEHDTYIEELKRLYTL